MSANSKIEWTETTWNPITGCTKVSPGCGICFAERITERFHGPGSFAEVKLHEDRLTAPLRWRKPRMVFVNSMSDLFHKDVPDEFIARAFAVMAATPQHTYQILTKRHARMRALLTDECRCGSGHARGTHFRSLMEWAATSHSPTHVPGLKSGLYHSITWPLPNVWLGVSVEDQKRASLRIPALLDTPATVRFISAEPLLGAVDLGWCDGIDALQPDWVGGLGGGSGAPHPLLDWVIVGGESGPGARPMQADWARVVRDDCVAAGVPFFFKQWGGRTPKSGGRLLDGRTWDEFPNREVD